MITDRIVVENIKNISHLSIDFIFPDSGLIVVTGKNGVGKTSLVKSFNLVSDPQIFQKSAGLNAIRKGSSVSFFIDELPPFSFSFDEKLGVLDSKDVLPSVDTIIAELPIPYGARFQRFSLISNYDAEIRVNIASSDYHEADELIVFLSNIYSSSKFRGLKITKVNKYYFYFVLQDNDYYVREDHLSSGEFFLIQIFRLITSGAKLILIDEFDVALDAAAQVSVYDAIRPLLEKYNSRLILITHSLAFMETVDDGGLYYLENDGSDVTTLENRSFGYIKSDLYGFKGRDRYIITEDIVLNDFLDYLIRENIVSFFEYEIIYVGGQPQVDAMAAKNDSNQIFGPSKDLIIFIDNDIAEQLKYKGESKVLCSPVADIELYVWENRERLLADVVIKPFAPAKKEKDTAKTYWKKVINSGQRSKWDLYKLIVDEHPREVELLVESLKSHLCLDEQPN
ncbi:MAG: hypothetical protein DRR42_21600 [Gammaproteobacteria bacterium]|nr:MAG: hypothetical protein DRR42_21600 [Gammaproteobacteria bacterium]